MPTLLPRLGNHGTLVLTGGHRYRSGADRSIVLTPGARPRWRATPFCRHHDRVQWPGQVVHSGGRLRHHEQEFQVSAPTCISTYSEHSQFDPRVAEPYAHRNRALLFDRAAHFRQHHHRHSLRRFSIRPNFAARRLLSRRRYDRSRRSCFYPSTMRSLSALQCSSWRCAVILLAKKFAVILEAGTIMSVHRRPSLAHHRHRCPGTGKHRCRPSSAAQHAAES